MSYIIKLPSRILKLFIIPSNSLVNPKMRHFCQKFVYNTVVHKLENFQYYVKLWKLIFNLNISWLVAFKSRFLNYWKFSLIAWICKNYHFSKIRVNPLSYCYETICKFWGIIFIKIFNKFPQKLAKCWLYFCTWSFTIMS